jgi:hypothetical protein
MIAKLLGIAAVAGLVFAGPASAAKMAACTEASMSKADAKIMKMPDGENKTMAMQEMTSAKSSMSQKDMAGCSDHMGKAMKSSMMKSKMM